MPIKDQGKVTTRFSPILVLALSPSIVGCDDPHREFETFWKQATNHLQDDSALCLRYGFFFYKPPYKIRQADSRTTPYVGSATVGVFLPNRRVGEAKFSYAYRNRKWVLTDSDGPSMERDEWQRLREHFAPGP